MTTTDRDELVALYTATLARFRTAQGVLTAHGESTTVPTRAELRTEAEARERMLELRRVLWPGWVHA
jgi:hypothetical protein